MSTAKEQIAGESSSGGSSATTDKRRKVFLATFAAFLLVAAVVAVVSVREIKPPTGKSSLSPADHAVVKASCGVTLYPDICVSAIANSSVAAGKKITGQKDVIEMSINITYKAVEHNYFKIEKILNSAAASNLTKREKTALHDCLAMVDETLDELHKAAADLEKYPAADKPLKLHADDLKTLISSALTNQESCLDGFSHEDSDKTVRKSLDDGQKHVEKMCSNALSMIKNMTDIDISEEQKRQSRTTNRKLKEEDGGGWPEWLSAGERRLLQSPNVTADVVVAADGSGDYTTVTEAVENAPNKSETRYVIKIKAGVYRENVEVSKKKTNLMFLGEGRRTTIITGKRNVGDGSTTFHSATVAAVGAGFLARDITFENTAGHEKHQAVALRVGSDLSAFYQCDILGHQDTLYVHSNRHFFVKCLIAGTVDFIFGNGAAVFQDCDILARLPGAGQKNMITAQGRKDPGQNTGIVIQKSRIGATSDLKPVQKDFPTYLGRPWKEFSRTVIMKSSISDAIHPAGWHEWAGDFALDTLVYGEYNNTGDGAGTSERVKWKGYKVMTNASEVAEYTAEAFIAGGMWLNGTGFPYSLGLDA